MKSVILTAVRDSSSSLWSTRQCTSSNILFMLLRSWGGSHGINCSPSASCLSLFAVCSPSPTSLQAVEDNELCKSEVHFPCRCSPTPTFHPQGTCPQVQESVCRTCENPSVAQVNTKPPCISRPPATGWGSPTVGATTCRSLRGSGTQRACEAPRGKGSFRGEFRRFGCNWESRSSSAGFNRKNSMVRMFTRWRSPIWTVGCVLAFILEGPLVEVSGITGKMSETVMVRSCPLTDGNAQFCQGRSCRAGQ